MSQIPANPPALGFPGLLTRYRDWTGRRVCYRFLSILILSPERTKEWCEARGRFISNQHGEVNFNLDVQTRLSFLTEALFELRIWLQSEDLGYYDLDAIYRWTMWELNRKEPPSEAHAFMTQHLNYLGSRYFPYHGPTVRDEDLLEFINNYVEKLDLKCDDILARKIFTRKIMKWWDTYPGKVLPITELKHQDICTGMQKGAVLLWKDLRDFVLGAPIESLPTVNKCHNTVVHSNEIISFGTYENCLQKFPDALLHWRKAERLSTGDIKEGGLPYLEWDHNGNHDDPSETTSEELAAREKEEEV